MRARTLRALLALAVASCIPTDDTPGLGSAEFLLGETSRTSGEATLVTDDGFTVHFDRIVLGFKTMTIGKKGAPDLCEYRGRGAATNLVVNPRFGAVQSFNGIQPVDCPDVGMILGSPDGATTLGPGVTVQDLVDLAVPSPVHALVDVTLTPLPGVTIFTKPVKLALRFDERASNRFAGCSTISVPELTVGGATAAGDVPVRGVRIAAGHRDEVLVQFAGESLFLQTLTTVGAPRAFPYLFADAPTSGLSGAVGDGVVTMDELDKVSLSQLAGEGVTYELPNGSRQGTFGDFVRALFGFTIRFRANTGLCPGIPPGTPEDL